MCWFLGHCYGNFVEKISLKALGNHSASIWSNSFSVLLLEGPKTQHFMMSGLLSPWEPSFMDLDIPNYFEKYQKDGNVCKHIRFVNLNMLFSIFYFWGKDGGRKIPKIHLIKSWKSSIWDQYLPKT